MPGWNEKDGNGQTLENEEGYYSAKKTTPLRKFKLSLIVILSLNFKKSILQWPYLDPDDWG